MLYPNGGGESFLSTANNCEHKNAWLSSSAYSDPDSYIINLT